MITKKKTLLYMDGHRKACTESNAQLQGKDISEADAVDLSDVELAESSMRESPCGRNIVVEREFTVK